MTKKKRQQVRTFQGDTFIARIIAQDYKMFRSPDRPSDQNAYLREYVPGEMRYHPRDLSKITHIVVVQAGPKTHYRIPLTSEQAERFQAKTMPDEEWGQLVQNGIEDEIVGVPD